MPDWSNQLFESLLPGGNGIPLTGLRRGMGGEEFEQQLGRFLRSVDAFRGITDLLEPSSQLPQVPDMFRTQGVLANWHRQVLHQLGEINKVIHESLYKNFAEQSIDTKRAAEAFGSLLQVLGMAPGVPFVFATTNYDTIATRVLIDLGWHPDWGTTPIIQTGGSGRAFLHADDILDGMPRYTPVLHLHGRVGWYLREGDRSEEIGNTKYSEDFGIPIVMLPDPNKDYGANATINSLWNQFELALARAKKVVVLGHSLNDHLLVQALQQRVPSRRLAVTSYAPKATTGVAMEEEKQRVWTLLPGSQVIQVRFGESDAGYQELRAWRDTIDRL
jgi:hypothetical protein